MLQGSPRSLASVSDMPEPSNEVKINISSYCLLTLASFSRRSCHKPTPFHWPQQPIPIHSSSGTSLHVLLEVPPGAPGAICHPTCNTKGCCGFGGRDLPERMEQAVLGVWQLWVLWTQIHHSEPKEQPCCRTRGDVVLSQKKTRDCMVQHPTPMAQTREPWAEQPAHLQTGDTCEKHVVASQAVCAGKKRHILL